MGDPLAKAPRDHGGGLDAAARQFGGTRGDWIDLSTGINPVPYPLPDLPADAWTALPDQAAQDALIRAARSFWNVPDAAAILATPGASAPIAQIPRLRPTGRAAIPGPTYNEHAAAFTAAGWQVTDNLGSDDTAQVVVHPNNPTGRIWTDDALTVPTSTLTIIDESFADVIPDHSLIATATRPGRLILKSFGKFWGLAGLRLGFVIGDPGLIADLSERLGPWPVSGPALLVGAIALNDPTWADQTRARLTEDAERLDRLMAQTGAQLTGGTSLFRLYDHPAAHQLQTHLAQHHIWTRVFPWSDRALRLGLPTPAGWPRVEQAIGAFA
jgi:cobalamin biosynthetic protein CobC